MDIEKILNNMTTEEKLCQMTQLNSICVYHGENMFSFLNLSDKQRDSIGSVLAYNMDYDVKGNLDEHLKNDTNKIPLIIMLDIIHGYKTIFPIPLAMGASFDENLVEECCKFSAVEATKEGVMVTFAPMVDLARDARWGRVMETTSEDPFLNGEFGKAMIRGYHKGGLACCVKHFAAYGAVESGRDYNFVDMSEHSLREYYLKAYYECLKEKPELVMTSFNSLNGVPATGDKHLMIDILRNEWGYDGVLITDYNAVLEMITHRFKKDRKEAAKAALKAGVDIEMCSSTFALEGQELVNDAEIDINTIDNSVRRILKLKEKMGLFENPYYKLSKDKVVVDEQGRTLARKMAEETFVLLKNNNVLPLKEKDKVAYIGPFVDTKEILGSWSMFADTTATVSVKVGVENLLGKKIKSEKGCGWAWNDYDESKIPNAIKLASTADKVVICFGEHQSESGECQSKTDIKLSKTQTKLIKELHKLGKPIIGVVFTGRPIVINEIVDMLDGLMLVWQPGTEGGSAIANALYGKVNTFGKLTMSFPRTVGQCPIYYNCLPTGRPFATEAGYFFGTTCYIDELNTPLFPFGFGLSYTKFKLSNLNITSKTMTENESSYISVNVKNIGDVDGSEVVQMYLRDDFSELVRPDKELKAYKRIFLKAGEEQVVKFEINKDTLSYYGPDNILTTEKGTFTIYISCDGINFEELKLELK